MNATFVRHFVAAQRSHEQQSFRLELEKLHRADITLILQQITRWSRGEAPGRNFQSYGSIFPGLEKWRIGNYRLYCYHLGGNVRIILHVYKKLSQGLLQSVKEKIIQRAIIYENHSRARDLAKYARFVQAATGGYP